MTTTILLPALTPEQYESLKADIQINGILVPIIRTETGETIDGHHRETIAAELGITELPIKIVPDLGEEERRHMAIRLNANRRQLTGEQKRHLIREELKRSSDLSNNWLAELLSVDDKTVQAVRAEEEMAGTITKITEYRCKDGKKRKYRRSAQKKRQVAAEETQQAPAVLSISATSQEPHAAVPLQERTILTTDQPPVESLPLTLPMKLGAQPTFEQHLAARMAAHGIQGTVAALLALLAELGVDLGKLQAA